MSVDLEALEKFYLLRSEGYALDIAGIGGLLLQQHNRDEQGYAIKATYCEVESRAVAGFPITENRELFKDPITDPGKKSHKGLLRLQRQGKNWLTIDQCDREMEASGELQEVFRNGILLRKQSFTDVRVTVRRSEGEATVESQVNLELAAN